MPPSLPKPSTTPAPRARVDLGALLAVCTEAAARGVRVIRAVHADREAAGGELRVEYKDVADPRTALTVADKCAQAAIVACIRAAFPDVGIVAEEDEEDKDIVFPDGAVDYRRLEGFDAPPDRMGAGGVEGLSTPAEFRDVALADLCVCIDPVDATHQFVIAKRLDAVQTLVGISFKGRPVAAAIGLPFHEGAPVISALVGAGVVGVPPVSAAASAQRARGKSVLTGSINPKDPVVVAAQDVVAAAENSPRGGAGNKLLAVARGEADVAILNRITCLWDTCATTALVSALGGKVTDLCGRPIRHTVDSRIGNIYGVVATAKSFEAADAEGRTHEQLCRDLRAAGVAVSVHAEDPVRLVPGAVGEAQATDVARDLDGDPLTADWLSSAIGSRVESYSAPEASAVRYLMSDCVRLILNVGEGESRQGDGGVDQIAVRDTPKSLFYKRVVLRDLEHVQLKLKTSPGKILRDVTSYQVESAFLGSRACKRLCESGARIPKLYHVACEPTGEGESLLDSRFSLLMEDYSSELGWSQMGLLERGPLRAVLASLADMHSFFWAFEGDKDYAELCESVWDRATYYTPDRQAPDLLEQVPLEWEKHLSNFGSALETAGVGADGSVSLSDLGKELSSIAGPIGERVHGVGANAKHPHRTVIHGDSKAANFFFRRDGSDDSWDVGMIDFQWSGFGHPMLDVAYTIMSSAAMSELSHDGLSEVELIKFYLESLHEGFVRHGKAANRDAAVSLLTLEDAVKAYDECMLDLAKLVFGYHWARIKASPGVLESRADMLGSNSYNKSVPHAVWLIARVLALVSEKVVSNK